MVAWLECYKKFLKGFKEMEKNKIEKIFEEFNKEFDIKIQQRRKKVIILSNVFRQFSDEIYRNSEILKIALKQKEKIVKEMKLNSKQQNLIENYDELENLVLDELVERAFIYGFSVSEKIKEEL